MHVVPVWLVIACIRPYLVDANPSPSLASPLTFGESTITATNPTSSFMSSHTSSGNSSVSVTPTSSIQFPSLGGFSACVSNCLQVAVSVNCSTVTDVNCYCNSRRFTQEIVNCTSSSCPDELATLESLAQQFCNLASQSPSLSFPSLTRTPTSSNPTPTSTFPSTTSTSSTVTTPASASNSNGASFTVVPLSSYYGFCAYFPAGVAFLGVLFGILLVD